MEEAKNNKIEKKGTENNNQKKQKIIKLKKRNT